MKEDDDLVSFDDAHQPKEQEHHSSSHTRSNEEVCETPILESTLKQDDGGQEIEQNNDDDGDDECIAKIGNVSEEITIEGNANKGTQPISWENVSTVPSIIAPRSLDITIPAQVEASKQEKKTVQPLIIPTTRTGEEEKPQVQKQPLSVVLQTVRGWNSNLLVEGYSQDTSSSSSDDEQSERGQTRSIYATTTLRNGSQASRTSDSEQSSASTISETGSTHSLGSHQTVLSDGTDTTVKILDGSESEHTIDVDDFHTMWHPALDKVGEGGKVANPKKNNWLVDCIPT